jgi:hypothetical protein
MKKSRRRNGLKKVLALDLKKESLPGQNIKANIADDKKRLANSQVLRT